MGLIIDLRNEASGSALDAVVDEVRLGRIDTFVTKGIFKPSLRRRAYSREDFARIVAATPFGGCDVTQGPIGFNIQLTK